MKWRSDHAQGALMAALCMGAILVVLLAWALLEGPANAAGPVMPAARGMMLAALAIAALMLPMVFLGIRASGNHRRARDEAQALLDGLPGVVFRYRLKQGAGAAYEALGPGCGQVFGLPRERLLGDATAIRELMVEEDRQTWDAALAASAQALSGLDVQIRTRKPDGAIRWLQCVAVPHREPGGDVVWHGAWSDITQARLAALEVHAGIQRLEGAQALAGIGDWTCNLASGSLAWSRHMYVLLQRDPGRGPPDLDEQLALFEEGPGSTADAFLKVQESGEPQAYEVTARLGDGHRVALQVIVAGIRDAAGVMVGMRGTMQDISARKALEERLTSAKNAAESANRAKSVFLASMSHEIRTPMSGILGIVELIGLAPLAPDLRSALDVVRGSGQSLLRIVDDILDFSKVEAGKLDVRAEPTSIREVVADVHRIYADSAASLGLELRHGIDPAITPTVMVDALRLRQILGNFVGNAIKFTPRGHVELRVQLLERDGLRERLRFVVEDTGIGIAPEAQQRLFQPFEQAESAMASSPGGTGLGLSIARRLAELMGGEVTMHSELGQGTRMTLDLPVTAVEQESLPDAAPHALRQVAPPALPRVMPPPTATAVHGVPQASPLQRLHGNEQVAVASPLVLVVDDHPTNRLVMRRQLNTLGYAAEEVGGGAEALERWRSGRFALVLTDCHMPEMTGYELSRRIREAEAASGGRRVPIIACSADVLAGVVETCMEAGMDDYLSKPTELRVLAETMTRWLPLAVQQAGEQASLQAPGAHAMNGGSQPGTEWSRPKAGDQPALSRRVIEQFRTVNDADAKRLLEAAAQGDMQAVTHFAHRIKGACGFIGATPLASVCGMVEEAGRAEDQPGVTWLMDVFRTELEQLNAHLDEN